MTRYAQLGCLALGIALLSSCGGGQGAAPRSDTVFSSTASSVTPAVTNLIGDIQAEIDTDAILADPNRHLNGPCLAAPGLDDIRAGADVVVQDSSGKTIALGQLETGSLVGDAEHPNAGWCMFHFNVPNVPTDQQFYSVIVGSRKPKPLTREDLEGTIELQIGEPKGVSAPS